MKTKYVKRRTSADLTAERTARRRIQSVRAAGPSPTAAAEQGTSAGCTRRTASCRGSTVSAGTTSTALGRRLPAHL